MGTKSIIIGIHGLENKPPLDEKTRWWRSAIVEGLRRNCSYEDEKIEFDFVYWADLRYDQPLIDDENHEPYYADAGIGPFPEHNSEASKSIKSVLSSVYESLNWLQSRTGVTPIDDAILKVRFDDLWHYHSERSFAREVRQRLRARIEAAGDRPILLVAHSMGSIVAYDVLRRLEREAPAIRIDHFVTLGSPLGLAEVKLKVAEEHGAVRVPDNVGRWSNLTDPRDVAAVAGRLAEDYAPNGRGVGVRDGAVTNSYRRLDGRTNYHKSYGYLRTPEFSEIVREFVGRRAR